MSNVRLSGKWKYVLTSKSGVVKNQSDWFDNCILTSGLYHWMDTDGALIYSDTVSDMVYTHISIGSGSSVASKTQTGLDTHLYEASLSASYSLASVNISDPTHPYIILGAVIPSGQGPWTIGEFGLCKPAIPFGDSKFFNRTALAEPVIKQFSDVMYIQCKISMVRASEEPDVYDVQYGPTTASSMITNNGLKSFLERPSFATQGTFQIGSNSDAPVGSDDGVKTLLSYDDNTVHSYASPFRSNQYYTHRLTAHTAPVVLASVSECAMVGGISEFRTTLAWTPVNTGPSEKSDWTIDYKYGIEI